jgi:hypothetical protein
VLIASVVAGTLWVTGGALVTFGVGAVLSADALMLLVGMQGRRRNAEASRLARAPGADDLDHVTISPQAPS